MNCLRRPCERRYPYSAAFVVEKDKTTTTSQGNCGRWLWVPASAGTTEELSDSIFKELTHLHVLATHCARGLQELCPRNQRAQGRPGARCTRGLVCNVHRRRRTRAYRFSGNNRPSLRNGFTAYFVLSPVNGFVATVVDRMLPTNLTPAPRRRNRGAQGRPGARCTRGLACNCAQRTRTRAYRFSGNTPAFPAQGKIMMHMELQRTAWSP